MSLNYDLTAVKPLPDTEEQWAVTQSLIFTTMAVGMGQITEENAVEFFSRQETWNLVFGFPPNTVGQILDHIGLKTNVSLETRPRFIKRMMEQQRISQGMRFARAKRELEEVSAN